MHRLLLVVLVRGPLPGLALALILPGCAERPAYDTAGHLRQEYRAELGGSAFAELRVPFELDAEVVAEAGRWIRPAGSERYRVEQILEFVFGRLRLRYALTPTRDAGETFRAREANCLSFVNLFVGLGRAFRLNPFYVEVDDYQRWNFRDGLVVSRGHIVAGIYVSGELETYDFLPYRAKSYRSFRPIDDRTAAAHYYNNLAAEALLADELERARERVETAVGLGPRFVKALNNWGIVLGRQGDEEGAERAYRRALEVDPADVPVLTNLLRLLQQQGRREEAADVLDRLGQVENTNPFFFLYKGELALGEGDLPAALTAMRQALRRDSELPEVHLGLVKVFLALGELDRARHHLERALKLDATDPEARRLALLLVAGTAP